VRRGRSVTTITLNRTECHTHSTESRPSYRAVKDVASNRAAELISARRRRDFCAGERRQGIQTTWPRRWPLGDPDVSGDGPIIDNWVTLTVAGGRRRLYRRRTRSSPCVSATSSSRPPSRWGMPEIKMGHHPGWGPNRQTEPIRRPAKDQGWNLSGPSSPKRRRGPRLIKPAVRAADLARRSRPQTNVILARHPPRRCCARVFVDKGCGPRHVQQRVLEGAPQRSAPGQEPRGIRTSLTSRPVKNEPHRPELLLDERLNVETAPASMPVGPSSPELRRADRCAID